jgi:predicted dehydrogenase
MTLAARRQFLRHVTGAALAGPILSCLAGAQPASKPRIKIGQIGVKHAHASKLGVYRSSPDYEVVGIVEPDAQAREKAKSQPAFKDLKWMSRDELLSVSGLQAVLVETEVCDLLDNAEVCIAAGKHIHLDKPAGESLPHFRRILDAAARQKLIVQMGYMFRYNPGVVLLRDLLRNGWLGEIFEVHAVMSKVVDPQSRRELAKYPGGIMFELGGHVMDLVIGVLGKPDRVTGFNRRTSKGSQDGLVDNMLAVLEYPQAIATVKSSAVEVEGFARRQLTVCGTEGTLHIQPLDDPSARLALSKPRGDYKAGYQDIRFPKYVRYVDDAADMARCLRGEKEFEFSYEHDLTVQTVLLQASGAPLDK